MMNVKFGAGNDLPAGAGYALGKYGRLLPINPDVLAQVEKATVRNRSRTAGGLLEPGMEKYRKQCGRKVCRSRMRSSCCSDVPQQVEDLLKRRLGARSAGSSGPGAGGARCAAIGRLALPGAHEWRWKPSVHYVNASAMTSLLKRWKAELIMIPEAPSATAIAGEFPPVSYEQWHKLSRPS